MAAADTRAFVVPGHIGKVRKNTWRCFIGQILLMLCAGTQAPDVRDREQLEQSLLAHQVCTCEAYAGRVVFVNARTVRVGVVTSQEKRYMNAEGGQSASACRREGVA